MRAVYGNLLWFQCGLRLFSVYTFKHWLHIFVVLALGRSHSRERAIVIKNRRELCMGVPVGRLRGYVDVLVLLSLLAYSVRVLWVISKSFSPYIQQAGAESGATG